jgi:hypothetical protein
MSEYSELDFQQDIMAALNINEALFGDETKRNDSDSISMACEVRGRLRQALEKAGDMFKYNLELLATISSLKKDIVLSEINYQENITVGPVVIHI